MGIRPNPCYAVTANNFYGYANRPCDGQDFMLYESDPDLESAGGILTFSGGGTGCTPTYEVYDEDGNVTTITPENNSSISRSFSSIKTVIGRCPLNPSGATNCYMNVQGTLFFYIRCQ